MVQVPKNTSISTPGTYSVTVKNSDGCTATSLPVNISYYTVPDAEIYLNGSTSICEGDTLTLTASSGVGWLWSNGATTQSIRVTQAGVFNVKITSNVGCTKTSNNIVVTLRSNPQPYYFLYTNKCY